MNVVHEAVPIGEALALRNEKVAPADYPELPYIGLDDIEAHSMRLLGSKPAASMKSSAKRLGVSPKLSDSEGVWYGLGT